MKDPKPSEGLKELHAKLNKPNQDNERSKIDKGSFKELSGKRYKTQDHDEMLENILYRLLGTQMVDDEGQPLHSEVRKLKAQIKAHYISRQEVEAALPDPSEYDHKHDAEIIVRDLRHTLGLGGSDG